jgi:Ulp1 family protease
MVLGTTAVTKCYGTVKLKLEIVYDVAQVPRQTNTNDCGVDLCLQVERVCSGLQQQLVTAERYFCARGHIAVELMLGRLLPWK